MTHRYVGDDDEYITGTFTSRYNTGAIRFTCECIEGIRHGTYKWYFPEGNLGLECTYSKGKIHGVYDAYSIDGSHIYSTMYYNGDNMDIDPRELSGSGIMYIMMSGRIPRVDW